MDCYKIPPYKEQAGSKTDLHAVFTITLAELDKEGLLDFSKNVWNFDAYNQEQRDRLYKKIKDRYYYREIGLTPPRLWQHELIRKLNEIMPKYKLVYKALDDGIDFLQVSNNYGKERSINSDFPQTMLSDNQDYASFGTDKEFEHITQGDFLDKIATLKSYDDVDVMILNDLESCFFNCILVR